MKADSSTFRTGVVTLVDADEEQISGKYYSKKHLLS